MRFRRIEGYLILGCYLAVRAFLGYSIGKERPEWSHIEKPNTVTVDIIKEDDDIWIVEHYSGELVFEYNRFKDVDKEAFEEYSDLLIEAQSNK